MGRSHFFEFTFHRASPQKQKRVRHLPLDCLLVETDSPVLGPESRLRNEPANLTLSIRAIVEISIFLERVWLKRLSPIPASYRVSDNVATLNRRWLTWYGAIKGSDGTRSEW
jgi:hypothetical protein